jgi:drug/metabolite transporter (DMT)-like permease
MSPGIRYMIVAAFFFSLMSVFVKWAGQTLPSQEIVLARALVTLVMTGALLWHRGISPWGHARTLLALRGLLGFVALSGFYWSVTHLPLADATVIQYSNPVFTALLAAAILGERLRRIEVLALAVSLSGVVLLAQPTFVFGGAARLPSLGVSIALAAAVLSAGAYVTVRRLKDSDDPLVVVFWFPLIAVPGTAITMLAPLALGLPNPGYRWPVGTEWLLLLAVGITTQIAQVAMTRGLHLEPAGRATMVSYLQIVFAFIWGAAFFGESLTWIGLAGATLVVSGTLVVARRRHAPHGSKASGSGNDTDA